MRSPPGCVHAVHHIQTFRKCMVSATPGNARSRAMGRLGPSHSGLLSPPGRENLVVSAARNVCIRLSRLCRSNRTDPRVDATQRIDSGQTVIAIWKDLSQIAPKPAECLG